MAQAGAAAPAVNTQGSCARQGVSMDTDSGCGRAETGVQAESLTAALVNQSCRALALAVGVTAAAAVKELRATAEAGRGNEKV